MIRPLNRGDCPGGRERRGIPFPVIGLGTAIGQTAKAHHFTADRFLVKPVKQSQLFDTIVELFDHGGRQPLPVAEAHAPGLDGLKILVVEDNRINQRVAREILGAVGMDPAVAHDGGAALEMLERQAFDVVLMDVQMPGMDGYEATRKIRAMGKTLPVIAMTANAGEGDREQGKNAGMTDYVTKPVDPDVLFAALARCRGGSVGSPARSGHFNFRFQ